MKKEEIKEKGIQGVKKIIFGRTLFVIFAFLIQFALLAVTYIWLRDYSYVFYLFFVILSVSVVLHLFNSKCSLFVRNMRHNNRYLHTSFSSVGKSHQPFIIQN